MSTSNFGPLDWRIGITDKNGRPTPEFQQRWDILSTPHSGPGCSVYRSIDQNITSGIFNTVQYNAKVYDDNALYSTATCRFTPTVSGVYQINASAYLTAIPVNTVIFLDIYLNGVLYKRLYHNSAIPNITDILLAGGCQVKFNGTTDYIHVSLFQNSGGTLVMTGNSAVAYFQASLI